MIAELDEAASTRSRRPLELFPPRLAERAAPEPTWRLPDATLRFLWESRSRGLQNGRKRQTAEARGLREAGLLNAFGAPTPTALELLGVMGAPTSTLVATIGGSTGPERWSCWFRDGTAVVDEEAQAEGSTTHGMDLVPPPVALARLIDWLGVAPAWSFADAGPVRLPRAAVDARCEDEAAPPPDEAGPALLRAFRGRLWRRVLVADATRRGIVAIRTDTGWWRSTPHQDGTEELEPLPSAALVQELLALMPAGGAR